MENHGEGFVCSINGMLKSCWASPMNMKAQLVHGLSGCTTPEKIFSAENYFVPHRLQPQSVSRRGVRQSQCWRRVSPTERCKEFIFFEK